MSSVYYNENNAHAAQWLRNLVAAGHLPAGDVDQRSILEVEPGDLAPYEECHFFAGIGGWPLLPCSSPDGPLTDLFGQVLAPASRSPPQASKAEPLTSGICGLHGFGSSASVALTLSLANRLRERLGSDGSIEFSQTWKRKATPAGRRYWAHTASTRRTSGSGCSGWPTARVQDGQKGCVTFEAALNEARRRSSNNSLDVAAQFAGWPTPVKADHWNPSTDESAEREWGKGNLRGVQAAAGWASPSARDWKDTPDMATTGTNPNGSARQRMDQLPRQAVNYVAATILDRPLASASSVPALPEGYPPALVASGTPPSGSPASTARRGALNPAFSRWLMGFPPAWDDCAPTATPSSRKPPQRS